MKKKKNLNQIPPLFHHQKHKFSYLAKYNTQIQMHIEARQQTNSKRKN